MTAELVLTNARIVLADEVVDGLAVDPRRPDRRHRARRRRATGEDMGGDFLIPGLVELHTDHLEGHYAPRPKVRWNPLAAVLAHDAQVATAGITTVFDALRVGIDEDSDLTAPDMRKLADAIEDGVQQRPAARRSFHPSALRGFGAGLPGRLRLFRQRRTRPAGVADGPRAGPAPVRQSRHLRLLLPAQAQAVRAANSSEFCDTAHRRVQCATRRPTASAISAACQARGIVLASHDDATAAHVEEAVEQGIRVAEFPTTAEAARASKQAGLGVLMGAPNVMRGGSHSGNVSARTLAEDGLLDILSSDYIPFSLIQSAFFLGEVVDGISLPQAVAMVSKNPAEAVGSRRPRRHRAGPPRRSGARARRRAYPGRPHGLARRPPRRMMVSALIEREISSAALPIRHGVFVAVVGPSGAGKDTRHRLCARPLRRRAAASSSSAASSPARATRRARSTTRWRTPHSRRPRHAGAFAISWSAHGLRYGLPAQLDETIGSGHVAVANVSRGAIALLKARYANVIVVEITASADILAQRLAARGRELRGEVLARLARSAELGGSVAGAIAIDNSGPREEAGR